MLPVQNHQSGPITLPMFKINMHIYIFPSVDSPQPPLSTCLTGLLVQMSIFL